MKKLSLLLVLALSTLFALAQNGRIDLRSISSAEITHSDFTSLRATFNYGSIESIEVPTERGTFSEIAIEGTYASGEIGTPELPASHQLLAVPFGATPRSARTRILMKLSSCTMPQPIRPVASPRCLKPRLKCKAPCAVFVSARWSLIP